MEQKNILIGEVEVPIIIDRGEEWFPVRYLSEKVLLRKGNIIFNKDYAEKYKIDYGYNTGGIQEVNCVSLKGIQEYVETVREGRMNAEQRKAFNKLIKYIRLDKLINEDEQFLHNPSDVIKSKLNDYELDAYNNIKNELNDDCWQKCSKCNAYYPFYINFFRENQSSPNGLNTFCRKCTWDTNRQRDNIRCGNDELTLIYKKYGLDIYRSYRDHETIEIYLHFLDSDKSKCPIIIQNADDFKLIIKYLHVNKRIDVNKLDINYFNDIHKLTNIKRYLTMHDIYQLLYGENYYMYPWRYKNFQFSDIKLTYELANEILKNYIDEFDIEIEDFLTYNYDKIIKESKIRTLAFNDILYFIVQFNNFEYAGYMFKTKSTNYYKDELNLLFDLRYLIEKDMKIPIDKIPLYLTRNNLQKHCRPLYHYIITNKHGSIFEWVNKLYPNKFVEADFEVNAYRNEFDSDTELYIHEILVEEFGGNVVYNQRNNNHTVKLKSKIPDWFIFTDKGVWVVEYFGMLDNRHIDNNRIRDYANKTKDKINTYKTLNGYNFLYLYVDDIADSFKGCREKILKVKEIIDK